MTTAPETPRPRLKREAGDRLQKKSRMDTRLAFGADLEIPVGPILTRDEEIDHGTKVTTSLRQLVNLLPQHPVAYRRFLARMREVAQGSTPMFSWYGLGERIRADVSIVERALEKAEKSLAKSPARARKEYLRGVEVLKSLPLDSETVYQWSRETLTESMVDEPLSALPFVKETIERMRDALKTLDEHRNQMLLHNLRLVLKEVFRYRPKGMRRSDLFQEGVLGLQKAVFRFDATRGFRFSTYATYWIRQSIRKSLIVKSRMIRIPQGVQEEIRKGDQSSLSESEASRVAKVMSETALFSTGDSASDDRFAFDVEDKKPASGVLEALHFDRIPEAVTEALTRLSKKEREVVKRRFGLGGETPQTLDEIGHRLNLSRERIRQIEGSAVARMQRYRKLRDIHDELESVAIASN